MVSNMGGSGVVYFKTNDVAAIRQGVKNFCPAFRECPDAMPRAACFTLPWRGRVGEHRQMLDGVG
jgi:hypothetical protein